MVSAQFLRNVPILKYNYSPIFVFYSIDWMHCYKGRELKMNKKATIFITYGYILVPVYQTVQ